MQQLDCKKCGKHIVSANRGGDGHVITSRKVLLKAIGGDMKTFAVCPGCRTLNELPMRVESVTRHVI